MKKLSILIIAHYWLPHRGGIETVASEQAKRLANRGHKVSVVTSAGKDRDGYEKVDGYEIYRVRSSYIFEKFGIPYPIFSWKLFPMLKKLVNCHDVVIAHGHSYIGSWSGAFFAKRADKPMVLLHHNQFIPYKFPWNVVELIVDNIFGKYALRNSTKIFATTEVTRNYAAQLVDHNEVEILHNGVDTHHFSPNGSMEGKSLIRSRLGLSSRDVVAFTVRRLVERNGIETLLSSAVGMNLKKNIKIVIAGVGPERKKFENLIVRNSLKNVHFQGHVSDQGLLDWYRASDFFVLPSIYGEGFGLVLLEAFACGLPVIATQSGGPQEIVDHGSDGFLIPAGSPKDMADAMNKMASHMSKSNTMSKNARDKAIEFSWEKNVDRLENCLIRLSTVE